MEVNLLTQENIEALAELYADVPQDVTEWNNDVFATVKDVVVEPFITQANNSITHSTALTNRVVDVLITSDAVEGRLVRRDENIDINALGADLTNSNDILKLCSTAYAQLESIGLKVRSAIEAGQVVSAQGDALLQNIIDLGTRYDDAVWKLWKTNRSLMFYPTAVQRELDDLTEDGLALFDRFSINNKLFSEETLQDDLEILKKYQEVMDQMVERAYVIGCRQGGHEESQAINGRKNKARETEKAILNKLNECINNWYTDLVDLTNKQELNEDDIKNATTILSNIDAVAHYYSEIFVDIYHQLTEYDANTLIRNKEAIDVGAMQTAMIHGGEIIQGLINGVNISCNKLQEMERPGVLNGNPNFNTGVDKCNLAKDAVCKLDNDFTQAWCLFSYSPLRSQREIDHFNNDSNQIVVNIGDQSYNFEKGSFEQLCAFAQCDNLFDPSTREIDSKLLEMFEVLMTSTIAPCQRLVSSHGVGSDVVQGKLEMIGHAKGCIETIYAKAVTALGNGDPFVKESAGRVKKTQEQYNQLCASVRDADVASVLPVEGGMDVNEVKNLFAQYRILQDVSGQNNNCFFNSVILQRGHTLQDQNKPEFINPLREIARINEVGDGWMANEECLQKVATHLQRPMVLLVDQDRDGQQTLHVTLACPLDANMLQEITPGEFDLSITADHLRNNSTVLHILTSRTDAELPVAYNDQAARIARVLGVWDEDKNTMVVNLQNMTVRDALVHLLQNQDVIVLYLNGGVVSSGNGQSLYYGHYQSYLPQNTCNEQMRR